MKVEATLTSDEYAALQKAPGRSTPQRIKWLVKFWQAVCAEHEAQEKAAKAVEEAKPRWVPTVIGNSGLSTAECVQKTAQHVIDTAGTPSGAA